MKLFTHSSAKLSKSQTKDWLNAVLYLEPSVDYKTMCRASTDGCRGSCLTNSGMMRMTAQTNARHERTTMYLNERDAFMLQLEKEIDGLLRKATKEGKHLALRLNGTSDVDWTDTYAKYPEIQFYEYTKRPDLILKAKKHPNVHMTFSRTESTKVSTMERMIAAGANVAVVFDDKKTMPTEYLGMPVLDGDDHDRRFEDGVGKIVGLTLKGTLAVKAHARQCGFAI
jgi:hypothetical protein